MIALFVYVFLPLALLTHASRSKHADKLGYKGAVVDNGTVGSGNDFHTPSWTEWSPCTDVMLGHVPQGTDEWNDLVDMVRVRRPYDLNKGKDVDPKTRPYQNLQLVGAFKVQRNSTTLAKAYFDEANRMRDEMRSVGGFPRVPPYDLATKLELKKSVQRLQDALHLKPALNEKLLLHGTTADALMPILCGKLDVPPNALKRGSGLLGWGLYLAEEVEKMDQYMKSDKTAWKFDLGLETKPHRSSRYRKPTQIYYAFGVKALLGHSMPMVPMKTRKGRASGENRMVSLADHRHFAVRVRHVWNQPWYETMVMSGTPSYTLYVGYNIDDANEEEARKIAARNAKYGPPRTKLAAYVTSESADGSSVSEAIRSNSIYQGETPEMTKQRALELEGIGFHSAKALTDKEERSSFLARFREYFVPYWSDRSEPVYLLAFARCGDYSCKWHLQE